MLILHGWQAAQATVPNSRWIADARRTFALRPSADECTSVRDEVGAAALSVEREEGGRRLRLVAGGAGGGSELLQLSVATLGKGGTAHLSKAGMPVATVWRAAGATAYTAYAARAELSAEGTSSSPLLYSCGAPDGAQRAQIMDARSLLVATVSYDASGCSVTVEARVDASVLLGVVIAAHSLR